MMFYGASVLDPFLYMVKYTRKPVLMGIRARFTTFWGKGKERKCIMTRNKKIALTESAYRPMNTGAVAFVSAFFILLSRTL